MKRKTGWRRFAVVDPLVDVQVAAARGLVRRGEACSSQLAAKVPVRAVVNHTVTRCDERENDDHRLTGATGERIKQGIIESAVSRCCLRGSTGQGMPVDMHGNVIVLGDWDRGTMFSADVQTAVDHLARRAGYEQIPVWLSRVASTCVRLDKRGRAVVALPHTCAVPGVLWERDCAPEAGDGHPAILACMAVSAPADTRGPQGPPPPPAPTQPGANPGPPAWALCANWSAPPLPVLLRQRPRRSRLGRGEAARQNRRRACAWPLCNRMRS